MITEKGTLIVGVDHNGMLHKDFILRPQLVSDSVDAVEDERARSNASYLGLCAISRQLQKLGDIPKEKITPELLMGMYEVDLAVISEASRRLQKKQRSFRGENKTAEKDRSGAAKAGL